MPKEYYFVSDLHIGGDAELQECSFEDDFLEFLVELAKKDKDTELILVGDSFGLWEFTELEGIDKLEELIRYHDRLFNQFRVTGEKIQITIIPGNHDYELACYPKFIERLKDFNIILDPNVSSIRTVGDKKIWIEHGMQQDEFNRMPDVYYPHYRLNYFIIREENNKLVINYHVIEKEAPSELSLLQRFVIWGRSKVKNKTIPIKTVVD